MGVFTCEYCEKVFPHNSNLKRHIKLKHVEPSTSSRGRHVDQTRASSVHCAVCQADILRNQWASHIRTNIHKTNCNEQTECRMRSAFKNRILTYIIGNDDKKNLIIEDFLNKIKRQVVDFIKEMLQEHLNIKFNCELFCQYMLDKEELEGSGTTDFKSHQTKMIIINSTLTTADIEQHFMEQGYALEEKMSEFQESGSGWTLTEISYLELNMNKYECIKASQYIPLPKSIRDKKACINVQNKDEYCFKWALISALHYVQYRGSAKRCSSYKIGNIKNEIIKLDNNIVLDFTNLSFPLHISEVKDFEANNPNISVNVFGLEDNKIVGPYYFTQEEKRRHINLLFLEDSERSHYVWIKNISRLMSHQLTKHSHKIYLCNTCLLHFHSQVALDKHKSECSKTITIMPSEDKNRVSFKNLKNQLNVPFVIYADFECILKPIDPETSSKVKFVQKHIPYAYSYYVKCSFDDSLNQFRIYSGEKPEEHFFKTLIKDCSDIYNNYLRIVKPMKPLTDKQNRQHEEYEMCHICKNLFLPAEDRTHDHCHLTGEYRGPAHKQCNLEYRIANFIPIFFHNFSSYDCHLFVRQLSSVEGEIKVIPLNKELYISVSKKIKINGKNAIELRFLDSYRFMSSSLNKLADGLSASDLKTVKSFYTRDNEFCLMRRKGVFPYDYLNSKERLEETQLPLREAFFNRLTNECCSIEDYKHAENVWKTFACKTLMDYLLLYLKGDVLLLCDIFENFRRFCKNIYNLDPCQYYTLPGLAWDAMLKYTKIELQLLTDYSMYKFVAQGIRGGIVQCSKRYSQANNKYIHDYDANKESNFIIHLDVNNLYGYAMSQYIPHKNFQWLENCESFDVINVRPDSLIGYILEVDLDYPTTLHDYHNDLPFCGENKMIEVMKQRKLITDLNNKTHYILHYRNLQQCLQHGLILKKIHKILQFNQSNWLKSYIDLNNHHRTLAKNKFEQNLFKFLNNAVYGKTMENVNKRKDIKLVSEWQSKGKRLNARALIAKPNFHSTLIIDENMVAIQMRRTNIVCNKPIYIGFSVLELSKWKMYNFHYDYMKPKYRDNLNLNYMDTDSFIYDIKTTDFYDDIRNDINNNFDTSDYPKDNIYNFPLANKKVLGMMKDECKGERIKEFVGLRAKVYSYKIDGTASERKRLKGVKQSVTCKLGIKDYIKCLLEKKDYSDSMYVIKSQKHQIYTQYISKLTLCYLDDKRYVREDGVNTYAWGHYKIIPNSQPLPSPGSASNSTNETDLCFGT